MAKCDKCNNEVNETGMRCGACRAGETVKHTPLPWVQDKSGVARLKDQAQIIIDNEDWNEDWVAIGYNDDDGFAGVIALCHPLNAAYIVRACNSHADLLAACKLGIQFVESLPIPITSLQKENYSVFYSALQRAIEKAEAI